MTSILLLASLIPVGSLEAPSDLTEHDWFVIEKANDGLISSYKCLSLHKGEKWGAGTAWYVDFDHSRDESLFACRGRYTFFSNKLDEGTLLLRVVFMRRYKGTTSGKVTHWEIDRRYEDEPTGVDLEIPMTGAKVETDPLTAVVSRAFWINDAGEERSNPKDATLGDIFRGRDEIRRTRHMPLGQTLEFRPETRNIAHTPPPPGFRTHSAGEASTTENKGKIAAAALAAAYGEAQIKDKKYESALQFLTKALSIDPDNEQALWNRANAYCEFKQYDRAIDDASHFIRLRPTSGRAYYHRGYVYEESGDITKALADYKEGVRLSPDEAEIRNELAWLMATCPNPSIRDGSAAIVHARKACELTSWKKPEYLDSLAAAYAEHGDFEDAIEVQEKAISLISDDNKAEYHSRLDLYRQHKPYRVH